MKKRIAILSLIAIFIAATNLSAQTAPAKPTKAKAKTEKKCEMKGEDKECCKGKTAAEKAKCEAECKKEGKACDKKDVKAGDKKDGKACCRKDSKACDKKDGKAPVKKAEPKM